MTETENLVLEQLRLIRKEIVDLKEAQTAVRVEISALGQQVAGLTTAVYSGHDRVADLERRMERVERRLDLTNG
ncbi:MAG: hypothetical protein ACREU9_00060 [Gammaproteobacteria bacterium]